VDQSRDEIYTADPSDKREIVIQVWYPAAADAKGESAVYLEDLDVMGPVLAERLGLPSFLLDHVNLVAVDAHKDAPLLAEDAPYPVLVFSHGLRGFRGQNTTMARELVSRGFVVVTIDHTYGNVITVFPDGRVALYTPEVLSGNGQPPRTSNTLVTTWADDIGFALDQLTVWNEAEGNTFASRLDLSKVGVFGHSTGGGTTVEFCGRDERCQVAVGLDAWLTPVSDEIVTTGLSQPFLFLRADQWVADDANDNFAIAESLLSDSIETSYLATITGADHFDFSDLPLFSPLTAQLGLSSSMDSDYVVDMMTNMTSAFFRQELKGEGENLLHGARVYPEMSLVGNGR
jgi:predicted dienelactone hydrolase